MTKDEIVEEFSFAISQPVMDDIIYTVMNKDIPLPKRKQMAIQIVLEDQGHWANEEEAEIFIDEVIEVNLEFDF